MNIFMQRLISIETTTTMVAMTMVMLVLFFSPNEIERLTFMSSINSWIDVELPWASLCNYAKYDQFYFDAG